MKQPKLIFKIERSQDGQFFVKIVMRNNEITLSGETLKRRQSATRMIDSMVNAITSGDYEVRDLTKSVATHKRR